MSTLVPCPACQMGDHDHHDGSHHGPPGVLGGHQCGCRGDCKPPVFPLLGLDSDLILLDALADLTARLAQVEALHVQDPREGHDECVGCRDECLYCEGEHTWPCPTLLALAPAPSGTTGGGA